MSWFSIVKGQKAWRDVLPQTTLTKKRQLDKPKLQRLSPEEARKMESSDNKVYACAKFRDMLLGFIALCQVTQRTYRLQLSVKEFDDFLEMHHATPQLLKIHLRRIGFTWKYHAPHKDRLYNYWVFKASLRALDTINSSYPP